MRLLPLRLAFSARDRVVNFLELRPEVPGELGDQSRLDASVHPPRVEWLHLNLTNWGGDDLLEVFPCFAVTPELASTLRSAGLTGYSLVPMKTTVGYPATELHPDLQAPVLQRLLVNGRAGHDDVGLDPSGKLIVSARCWDLLRAHRMEDCEAWPWARAGRSGEI